MNRFFKQIRNEQQELTNIVNKVNKRSFSNINHLININDSVNQFGITLLLYCAMYGHTDLVEKCIKLGAIIDVCDSYLRTPLCWALTKNDKRMINLLLKAGANPNIKINEVNGINCMPIVFFLINQLYFQLSELKLLIQYGVLLNDYHLYINPYFRESTFFSYFFKVVAKRRWVKVKCIVVALSLHKRAVERVNHPDRLLEQGVFEIEI
jgi:hypothetical protein